MHPYFSSSCHQGGRPAVAGISITDIMSGMYANGAICAALYERRTTNKGKRIHCSLLQSQVSLSQHTRILRYDKITKGVYSNYAFLRIVCRTSSA